MNPTGNGGSEVFSVPMDSGKPAKADLSEDQQKFMDLPGRRSHFGIFEREGFFDMVRERGLDADLVETDLHLGYYVEGTYAARLWDDVVAPARAAGGRRIWLVGI